MAWLFVAPILLMLLSLGALLPYTSFRLAARNVRRSNRERSTRRTHREIYHLRSFLRDGVLVPLLVLLALQGTALAVHYYVLPDTTLSEIFGEYHPEVALNAPDLDAWNEAIEAKNRDRDYEAWRQAQGLAPAKTPPVTEVMVEHWPLHFIFLLLPLAYAAWFFRRRYFAATQAYHRGVLRRAKRYARHAAANRYASPPGMLNENFGCAPPPSPMGPKLAS